MGWLASNLCIPSSATTGSSTLCQGRLYVHIYIYRYIYIYIYIDIDIALWCKNQI